MHNWLLYLYTGLTKKISFDSVPQCMKSDFVLIILAREKSTDFHKYLFS